MQLIKTVIISSLNYCDTIEFDFWSILWVILTSHFTLSCSERTQKTRSFWTATAGRVKITRSPPNKLVNILDKDQACMGGGSIPTSTWERFWMLPLSPSLSGYLSTRLLPAQTFTSLANARQHTFWRSSLSTTIYTLWMCCAKMLYCSNLNLTL